MAKIDEHFKVHSAVTEMIKFADTKASIALTAALFLTKAAIDQFLTIPTMLKHQDILAAVGISLIFLGFWISLACCLWFLGRVVIPRLSLPVSQRRTYLYFEHVASMTVEEYTTSAKSEAFEYTDCLLHQVHSNSVVARSTFWNLKIGLWTLAAAFLLAIPLFLLAENLGVQ